MESEKRGKMETEEETEEEEEEDDDDDDDDDEAHVSVCWAKSLRA